MKILVLGASGMIGSAMLRALSENPALQLIGSIRSQEEKIIQLLSPYQLIKGIDLEDINQLNRLFKTAKPDVLINCAGVTKHLPGGNQPIPAITLNALLPHRLAEICNVTGTRLIHVSTDCVFSGQKGMYKEDDLPDAIDIYGQSKHLGEVVAANALTLRTSTIGHEIGTKHGLLEWFLSQKECKGYQKAIFSGLPTIEFARVVRDYIIPNKNLAGIYHIGAKPIDKYSLLRLIAVEYKKSISIIPSDELSINRSLNVEKFKLASGYKAPEWPALIHGMRKNII
jgi:dTDP-4-dehydrorhamnose reductase